MLYSLTNKKKVILACFFIFFTSLSIQARNLESQTNIKSVVTSFINNNVSLDKGETLEIVVNPSNNPIEVSACANPLTASFPKNSGIEQLTSVEVSCKDDISWNVIIPVDLQIYTNVLVTKRIIQANESINQNDIDYIRYNKNKLYSGFFSNKEDIAGTIAKHLLPAGTILTKKNIQLPYIVRRNQSVQLISKFNAVSVTMQGIAKDDGALNANVKVLNPSSKKTVDAIVIGPNKVQIIG